jgi:purine-binding chemotaxis protein CheW
MQNITYLIVSLADELFGIRVEHVIEAIEPSEITPVPNTAPYIKGITNFRGDILTVIDMRTKFNMPLTPLTSDNVIVVLEFQYDKKRITLGAIADAVNDVAEFNFAEIADLPAIGTKYNTEFIEGLVRRNNEFVVLLNTPKIFSVDEITIITESGIKK